MSSDPFKAIQDDLKGNGGRLVGHLDRTRALRGALRRYDLDAIWTHVAPHYPGREGTATKRNYLSALKDFIGWARDNGQHLAAPDDNFGRDYLTYLHTKHDGRPTTITTRLSQARTFYKVLRRLGAVGTNLDPFSILERPSFVPGERRDYYDDAEVARLVSHANVEDRALVLLGAQVGLATGDIVSLRWSHVQLTRGELRVHGRLVHTSDEVLGALRAYAATRGVGDLFGSDEQVFEFEHPNSLRSRLYRLCKAANVEYRAWRALRHHAGLRLYRLTNDAELVRRELGLSTLQLTEPYQRKLREEQEQARQTAQG
ncbi:tyrosine-type recombinase/integrase [Deinococcus pimensis]|uniref:tyrosine-type recombinase/integrase n=1 Tax=Deinococcus pimensis TaxID=309888 RepID=UPI000487E7FB|nr:site-specific integrase [Deinococcus pimensis]